jgi:hypothetical protein
MFKITQNTLRRFSLAELLLMAAINQIGVSRKIDPAMRSRCERTN